MLPFMLLIASQLIYVLTYFHGLNSEKRKEQLKAGDCWCLCASRWKEAYDAGVEPPVNLNATHEKALEFATINELKQA